MKYFVYCRKSSEAEDRQVASIESQLTTLQERFGQNETIKIVDVYEEAFSAKAPGRPLFNAMLARIERGEAQGIIAWAPDRLARNSIDGGRIVYSLDRGTIQDLKFATYTFENNSQGKFMLQIMFGQSKYYSDALSENVKRGNRTKLEKGWRPNQAPLGYLNDKATKTIVKDPDRYPLIRRMFDAALGGSHSVRHICHLANNEWGFRTPQKKRMGGKPLALSGLYKVLTNPFYAGLVVWNGKVYPGAHEPIVSTEELNRVQAWLRRRDRPKPKTREFAFTGLIRCGECGRLVTAEEKVNRYGSHYTYYHCTKRRPDYRCRQRSITVERLEAQIEEFLATLQIPRSLHGWTAERLLESQNEDETHQEAARTSLERSLHDTNRALDTLTSLRLRELIEDAEFVAERQRLQNERTRLQQELQRPETTSAFEPGRALILFSNRAMEWFRAGDAQIKRLILESVGSNLVLIDKILRIEAKIPIVRMSNIATFLQLRRVVENIRTMLADHDPEFLRLLGNIRELEVIHGIQSADAAPPEAGPARSAAAWPAARKASRGGNPSRLRPPA
jgi:DNA invertase Pin-like site-specific DNA recombinase